MRLSVAVAVALMIVAGVASAAQAHARVAISEFQLDGSPPPALSLQLQDGFVLGLVRAGVQVIDPTDTAHKLEVAPRAAALRLFSLPEGRRPAAGGRVRRAREDRRRRQQLQGSRAPVLDEGAAPAALPIATESKSCEVCTVAEARATMLKLADALRTHIDEPAPHGADRAPAPAPAGAGPPGGPGHRRHGGRACCRRGCRRLAGNGDCTATSCSEGRARNAMGGVLIGAGAALTLTGAYVTIVRARGGDPITGAAVGWRW